MAKRKLFAVEVEFTVKRTLYVTARRPNGAVDALYTEEGWREATAYAEDPLLEGEVTAPKGMSVTKIREV